PHELRSAACTLAGEPTVCVWVAGVRLSVEPGQGSLPICVHWVDSLVPAGHAARSMPPVLSTCPVSVNVLTTPLIDRSICGITPDWSQRPAHPVPFGPMSEVSKNPALLSQPSAAPDAVWVTISW